MAGFEESNEEILMGVPTYFSQILEELLSQ